MATNDIISSDLQVGFVDSPFVELFELDIDGTTIFFHPGLDESLDEIQFYPVGSADPSSKNNTTDANTYIALPVEMTGVEATSDGVANRPSLTLANVTSVLRSALDDEGFDFEDLVGARLTRRRTFAKYLVGGDEASSPFEFPISRYLVERVQAKNRQIVVLELTAPFDLENIKIPARVVIGKYCSWIYQGLELHDCGGCTFSKNSKMTYDGTDYDAFFDLDDVPLLDDAQVSQTTWASGTTYSKNQFVTRNSKEYQSTSDSNVGNDPATDSLNWRLVRLWNTYSASTAYSVDDLVKYDNHIWKCITAGTGKTPVIGSLYWTRIDYCSKTLAGCKARFAFKPTGNVTNVEQKINTTLPFGGFPGSAKFK